MLQACEGSIGKAQKIYGNREIYLELDKIFNNIENYTVTDVISKMDILYKYLNYKGLSNSLLDGLFYNNAQRYFCALLKLRSDKK